MPNFFAALQDVGSAAGAVFVGGAHRTTQEREQWTSACNFLALAPGMILSYRRNEATLEALKAAGFRVVSSVDFVGVR